MPQYLQLHLCTESRDAFLHQESFKYYFCFWFDIDFLRQVKLKYTIVSICTLPLVVCNNFQILDTIHNLSLIQLN